ncbi:MAG: ferritin family protein [Chloroflexi bacterium]|nr:ferritin family protein [Chloroflexota bacterium]
MTMADDQRVEGILREAIQGEIESYELYTGLAERVTAPQIKDALCELAQEELGHKALLEKMLTNPGQVRLQIRKIEAEAVQDAGVGDHLIVEPLKADATFQDVCIFASQKEQQSYELYHRLAEQNSGEIQALFTAMAKDELRHKDLVERWYEEDIYQDN